MSVGIFGNIKLADVDFSDMDILYVFSPSREELGDTTFQPLFSNVASSDVIKIGGSDSLYKLRLPASVFNKVGFYNILIKPKTFETTILDCSFIISTTNNVSISKRGIVVPSSQFQRTGNLTGYQLEYFDKNNVKIKNLHRIITSSDLVSVSSNNNNIARGSTNYVLDSNGSFLFLTVTPDSSSLISNNSPIDIGQKGQKIMISGTQFSPVVAEVEITDINLKTLSYYFGNSTIDRENGVVTYYNDNNLIYKQYLLFENKKQFSNGSIDVKQEKSVINPNLDFKTVSQGLAG